MLYGETSICIERCEQKLKHMKVLLTFLQKCAIISGGCNMNILFLFRKEDAIKLDLIHIAKLDNNGTRFFYQKKKFQLPQYVPHSLPGTNLFIYSSIH